MAKASEIRRLIANELEARMREQLLDKKLSSYEANALNFLAESAAADKPLTEAQGAWLIKLFEAEAPEGLVVSVQTPAGRKAYPVNKTLVGMLLRAEAEGK